FLRLREVVVTVVGSSLITSVFPKPAGNFELDSPDSNMRIGTSKAWAMPTSYCTQDDFAAPSDHKSKTASACRILSVIKLRILWPRRGHVAGSSMWADRNSEFFSQLIADRTSGWSAPLCEIKILHGGLFIGSASRYSVDLLTGRV